MKEVKPEDEGKVTCIATNPAGQDMTNFTLEVMGMLLGISELLVRFYFCKTPREKRYG